MSLSLPVRSLILLTVLSACHNREQAGEDQWPISRGELQAGSSAIDSGEEVYRRYCTSCHGFDGRGNGGTTGADFVGTAQTLAIKSDNELIASVRDGKQGQRAVMPAHRPVLTDAQLQSVVAYVRRRFLGSAKPPTPPTDAVGDPANASSN